MKSTVQEMRGRMLPMLVVSVALAVAADNKEAKAVEAGAPAKSPTECCYAPPGEYVKDHTLIYHDGWWHLFSQSGTEGYFWGNSGNEETVSWSISRDLVNWEFRGHVLHASQRKDHFDQHGIWATFCLPANGGFYMFYGGGRLPVRPVEYRKLGTSMEVLSRLKHGGVMLGVARSEDLTSWEKVSDPLKGINIRGRDPHVVRDEQNGRWLLYSTQDLSALVSHSKNLLDWQYIGECAHFPAIDPSKRFGRTKDELVAWCRTSGAAWDPMESLTVMRHPLSGQWIMLGNFQYAVSDDPTRFLSTAVQHYDLQHQGRLCDLGFACETIQWNGKWYRSGVFGKMDRWKLGFTEIQWLPQSAFRIVQPSVMSDPK